NLELPVHQRHHGFALRLPDETACVSPPCVRCETGPRQAPSAPRYWPPPPAGECVSGWRPATQLAPRVPLLLLGRLGGRGPLRQAEDQDVVAQRETDLEVAAASHCHELLAFEREGHRRRVAPCPGVELPKQLAALRVIGVEVAVAFAGERDAAGGRKRATHHRLLHLVLPGDLTGVEVERGEEPVLLLS